MPTLSIYRPSAARRRAEAQFAALQTRSPQPQPAAVSAAPKPAGRLRGHLGAFALRPASFGQGS